MNNYMLTIQYDGTAYNGWQKQKNTTNTIQGILENKLSNLLNEQIELNGSGRTDRGVHAKGQTANFKTNVKLDVTLFLSKLNQELPLDILITKLEEVDLCFHSRLSAIGKRYSYHIYYGEKPNVFLRRYLYHQEAKLDFEQMKKASELLIGVYDYRGFSSEKNMDKNCVREIYDITFIEDKEELILCFYGNGFLYNMVRILSGTLLGIGNGTLSIQDIEKTLLTKNRNFAGETLPSKGLVLEQVFYKNIELRKANILFTNTKLKV